MDIHVTRDTSKSWKVVYVARKFRQLPGEYGLSEKKFRMGAA